MFKHFAFCIWICVMPLRADAIPMLDIPFPELVRSAGIICVGTVTKTSSETSSGPGSSQQPLVSVLADVDVESTLKGVSPGKHIQIEFNQPNPKMFPTEETLSETQLAEGEHAILLLKPSSGGSIYQLVSSSGFPLPKVDIGNSILPIPIPAATPFRRVILSLVQALPNVTGKNRGAILEDLQDISFLTWGKGEELDKLRQDLGEDAHFQAFLNRYVLPAALADSRDPDLGVRTTALAIAAILQDVDALPKLRSIAETYYPSASQESDCAGAAADAIGYINTAKAIPFLMSAIKSPSSEVRYSALGRLVSLVKRLAIPLLLDHLADSNKDIHNEILWKLPLLTGQPTPKNSDQAQVEFWQNWGLQHPAEVNGLRNQLKEKAAVIVNERKHGLALPAMFP